MSRHIPWSVAVPPEVHVQNCGVTMEQYHTDPAVQMHVQLRGPEILHERFGLPLRRSVRPDFTAYLDASVHGLEVDFGDDRVPAPLGHPITSIEQAAALRVPDDISRAGMYPRALEFYEYMKSHAPEDVTVGFGGGHQGPFTAALLLRGQELMLDIYDRPDLAHRFLATIAGTSIRQREFARQVTGDASPLQAVGFGDDYGGLLPPELYVEFDVSYMLRVAEHFGVQTKTIHTELLRRPHLKILQDHGWVSIDVGTDPHLTVRDCREVLSIPFLVQFRTSEDMLLSNPEQVKRRYRQMVADGAERMMVEICRGVPDENIRAFIEVAREYE